MVVALASTTSSFPTPDGVKDPFLSFQIIRPGQSAISADVSKQGVHVRQSGAGPDREEYAPFKDHVPPFLALPPVKEYPTHQTTHYFPEADYGKN